ncbi:putative delta(7)-sterol 5(6)-desaturase [Colletotrichum spaethianum]|uniref:Delta(7)-sterol 5(6)-desaturase n=1 Tax=Colletotrichum spaethianum TaxID=700344 RepID=A0AA37LD61_9PEZI|nr:putative delta(7)-sterol 5(6)-desaturase [Colletotrichum spaethianum]GKT43810.1 putative delta(7)-sterol 5(6)-desaturase [Colletotrichum spaethianum]
MDVVLEVVDTFVGDKLYAALLPAHAAPYDFPHHPSANATAQPLSTWQYKPRRTCSTSSPPKRHT